MATKLLRPFLGNCKGRSVFQFVSQNRDKVLRLNRLNIISPNVYQHSKCTLAIIRPYSSQPDGKEDVQLKTVRSTQLLQEAIQKRTDMLKERKEVFVQDMKDKKSEVQRRVKNKFEEIVERENVLTIPNLLCVSRGLMAPYLGFVVVDGNYTLAMGLLIFAGITDLVSAALKKSTFH